MSAICAPTVNAYKRLKPDMLNGYLANWGFDDRTVGVRVPPARGEGSRVEHRMADAAANPYLTGAALLHAARIGVVEELELGPRRTGSRPQHGCRRPEHPCRGVGRAAVGLQAGGGTWRLAGGVVRRAQARGMGPLRGGRRDVRHGGHPWEIEYYLPYF